MYQRKSTLTKSTLQYCQHTKEYLKGARSGKGTTGSVLGTSPFLTKASTGAGTRKTGAAANHEGRGQGTRDHHPAPNTGTESTQAQDQEPDTQTDDQTEKQPPGQPGQFSAGGTSALFTPFRRCFDRFLGRRPRHAAALGVRFTSQEQMGRPCRVLLRSWLVSDQLRLSDQQRPFRS